MPNTFGLRIALWYAGLFVASASAIALLTYYLTASSLAARDRQLVQAKAAEYAVTYARGGLRQLTTTVQAEQTVTPSRLVVRVTGFGVDAVLLSTPDGWDPRRLEIGSARLDDGTLVQVGKSTDERETLLARFRAVLGLVTLAVMLVAVGGGWFATQSALAPIHRLTQAVRRIIVTGRTDARVPREPQYGDGDAIDELVVLFNSMLDRIEGLVTAMRGSLDNVSHDLRTPLTRLRGRAELALAAAPDVSRYQEALADCVEESDRILVMLNTLMDISEAESGVMQLQRQPVDLREVVGRAIELYSETADARGVTLVPPSGDAAPVVVSGDRPRLEQVAANLLDNAVKYTPAGGHVDVLVSTDGREARLEVRDTGPGITTDELPHIWQRLYRGDRSRTERGLGLGLSLVKAVVEAHAGRVTVDSTPGQGATFVVCLPAGPPPLPKG